ncbi:MAG: hypothetical protein ABI165_11020, partial [Bryobacteraceae bacterium]
MTAAGRLRKKPALDDLTRSETSPMDQVFDLVATYGYAALYVLLMLGIVGLPIPDETILVFTGYLISRGTLKPVPALLTAVLGSSSGITVSYILGRTLGLEAIHKFGKYL